MQETRGRSLDQEDPLEKEMATHYSIFAWRVPWTEESGGLQSMQSQRVGHSWATNIYNIHSFPCGPASHPPDPTPLAHHRVPRWAPCAVEQPPASYLFCTWYRLSFLIYLLPTSLSFILRSPTLVLYPLTTLGFTVAFQIRAALSYLYAFRVLLSLPDMSSFNLLTWQTISLMIRWLFIVPSPQEKTFWPYDWFAWHPFTMTLLSVNS